MNNWKHFAVAFLLIAEVEEFIFLCTAGCKLLKTFVKSKTKKIKKI